MESINSFFNKLFSPFYSYTHFLLRITLGISFFLHGFGKFKTIIGDGSSIGSNTALVAPVKIGAGAIIGAGSTITADVPNDAIATTRSALDVRHNAAVRYRKIRNEQS